MIIDLSGGTVCTPMNSHPTDFEVVDNDGRVWSLRAKTSNDARDWVDVIATKTGVEELSSAQHTLGVLADDNELSDAPP